MTHLPEGKAPRRSAPKVRSGCLTWIRKVKCDEAKPACVRCTSTGRRCDGYDFENRFRSFKPAKGSKALDGLSVIFQQNRTKTVPSIRERVERLTFPNSLAAPLTDMPLVFSNEQRSLDFFLRETAPALGGFFDVDFWSRLIPRVASAEKSIQHALIAIATVHEESLRSNDSTILSRPEVSLSQYNKAIRSLNQRLLSQGENQRVILLTCILFICLEFLRGKPETGLDHFQSGLKILVSYRQNLLLPGGRHSHVGPGNGELDELDNEIEHAFARLSIQASIIGRAPPRGYYQNIGPGPLISSNDICFDSIQDARDRLNALMFQSLCPNELLSNVSSKFNDESSLMVERYKLVLSLNQWTSSLKFLITNKLHNLSNQDADAILLLRIQSLIAILWNSTTLSDDESRFDRYKDDFSTIVSLASQIISNSTIVAPSNSSNSPSRGANDSSPRGRTLSPFLFAMEMGVMFALFFSAVKCRCPIIRRNAKSLLSRVEPQRQGVWDARILERICEYVILFEEAASFGIISGDPESWPAAEHRIHSTFMEDYAMEKSEQKVMFSSKPSGPEGDWAFWSEIFSY